MNHPAAADRFVADRHRCAWHDRALWFMRRKRDAAAAQVPEWERLRETAAAVKTHTLAHLDRYLEQFEARATDNGIQVHWALDAAEHNRIVLEILRSHGARKLVKSKSMLTEECGLNPYLAAQGIQVVDTDLGERIIQLAGETPSHIVLPAIHKSKADIGQLFHRDLGTPPELTDPTALTAAARVHLRRHLLAADAALTGVNFAVAESGGFVVCTNEGNADLGVSLPALHIASMGIEKIIPRLADLGVFVRLLARSATGQAITTYTTHFHGPPPGGELHLILVDNGRSRRRAQPRFSAALHCIRCGACLNTCPVYRRSGGHSYGHVIPGPIGSVLAPARDLRSHRTLPFACTLCGSCTALCPVRIDLDRQLYHWRQVLGRRRLLGAAKQVGMRALGRILAQPHRYRRAGRLTRWLLPHLPRRLMAHRLIPWGRSREMPAAPRESFGEWYSKNRGKEEKI